MDSSTMFNEFLIPFYLLLIGSFLAPLFKKTATLYVSSLSSSIACITMTYLSLSYLGANGSGSLTRIQLLIGNYPLVGGVFSLSMDGLSAYFIIILGILGTASSIYGISYVRRYAGFESLSFYSFIYPLFIMSMYLVLISGDVILFIISWELMSISAFFLISFERASEVARRAALKYLLMSYTGSGLLIVALVSLSLSASSTEFTSLRGLIIGTPAQYLITLLFIVGFGIKAALVPMHSWLPDAHPEAPSNISALLSGFMIKTAVYGIMRFTIYLLKLDLYFLGFALATLGVLSAVYGTLMAIIQGDSKKLMAHSSIAQIGYIFLGIGGGLVLYPNYLGLIALVSALFHTLNHAIFKGLLFLTAGSIIYRTESRDLNRLGGLARYMPITYVSGLVASLAISGIPPLNGFVSKWLIILPLIISGHPALASYSALAIFASALTTAALTKYVSRAFLSGLGDHEVSKVKEVPSFMAIPEAFLAALCVLLGFFYFIPINVITSAVVNGVLMFELSQSDVIMYSLTSLLNIFGLILGVVLISTIIGMYLLVHKAKITSVWTFGTKELLPKKLGLNAVSYYTEFEYTYGFGYRLHDFIYKTLITPLTKCFISLTSNYNKIDTYLANALLVTAIFLTLLMVLIL
ncbi:MAG: proton-conducting transporter membrane subunit [Sulfolobales archaeon]|nr:hypothetical protein [Sulfolobales archaeon]MCX8186101.1 proton-conducting transporter membrane subunit [Sulfolobales archaeon]MDW7969396.1 proton-conducting transporter membrane subunit [Sulfolobales archaeon]